MVVFRIMTFRLVRWQAYFEEKKQLLSSADLSVHDPAPEPASRSPNDASLLYPLDSAGPLTLIITEASPCVRVHANPIEVSICPHSGLLFAPSLCGQALELTCGR